MIATKLYSCPYGRKINQMVMSKRLGNFGGSLERRPHHQRVKGWMNVIEWRTKPIC